MKPVFLFSMVLVATVGMRAFSVTGSVDAPATRFVPSASHDATKPIIFPEDVLPVSAQQWQSRYGCDNSQGKYIGYTERPWAQYAVIRDGSQENIYTVGDRLTVRPQPTIISIDSRYVVTRTAEKVAVLCRDDAEKKKAYTAVTLPAVKSWSNSAGEVTQVRNAKGELIGYRLRTCLRYCWLLKQFAIKPGDTLLELEGVLAAKLTAERIKEIVATKKEDLNLVIERDGQRQSLIVPWRRLAPLLRFIPEAEAHD